MVSVAQADLWAIALERQHIDPEELSSAIKAELCRQPLDYRTRLLIRAAAAALEYSWGSTRMAEWTDQLQQRALLASIRGEQFDQIGFPSLTKRVMEPTRVATVEQFFRELGQSLAEPVLATVGGSVALILQGTLSRRTEYIDLVDEIPVQIRSQHELLDRLAQRLGLRLAHFQSHFLPSGWESRVRSFSTYGNLQVQLVDACDIFLGKLFSAREKDRDDLRALQQVLDPQTPVRQLVATTAVLRTEPTLLQNAQRNWYIVFGTPLPV
jgi:hypothetical protein